MKKTKFSIKILYAQLISVLFFTSVKAITFYVSPSGNDNSSGISITSAWKTIGKINGLAVAPGTTILFEGGQVFNGGIYLDNMDANSATSNIIISSYGTGEAIIRSGSSNGFYAYNTQGITISNLIFEGSGTTTNFTDGVLFYTDLTGNIKLNSFNITNVEVRNYGKTGISLVSANGNTGFKDVVIDGAHVHHIKQNGIITNGFTSQTHTGWAHQNVTIKNTEVDNVTGYADPASHRGSGIILGQVDKGLIEKSAAHDNGSGNTHCGGPGGIWAWDCNNLTIQHCESFHNSSGTGCDGLGFDLDGGVTNSLMQYNYSHDNDGAGYLLGQYDYARPWSNNVVRYNISENDGRTNAGGITLFKGAGTSMSGCKIYNNSIYITPSATNATVGAFTILNWNTGITGIELYNNIFQTAGGASLIDVPAGYSSVFTGNLYWSSGDAFKIKYHGATYSDISAWRSVTGNEQYGSDATGITADPHLKNAGNGGTLFPNSTTQLDAYTLENGSPAIDAGLDLVSLFSINPGTQDFFNNVIYTLNAPDIGAHEFTQDITTAIDPKNKSGEKIVFYPNPVRSGSPIFMKGNGIPYSAELISMTGESVWKVSNITSKEYILPTINLPAGMYILILIDTNGRRQADKVIVE